MKTLLFILIILFLASCYIPDKLIVKSIRQTSNSKQRYQKNTFHNTPFKLKTQNVNLEGDTLILVNKNQFLIIPKK